ncbi:leucine-rich repeat-containing protein let-4-like [Saccostrea cucullata]|uniref:leucine-rich repeat-containing protein let-4-like n=1 Tax=Saccostrea cuccullata TaxID=36930 RepID=UPI002ED16FC5
MKSFTSLIQIPLFVLVASFCMAEGFLLPGDVCPFNQKCTCTFNRIDCSYRYLTEVMNFTSYNQRADYVGLNHNFITSIQSNSFSTLFSASSRRILIRLDYNRIDSVDVDAFAGMPSNVTVVVYLNDNNLKTIPPALEKISGLSSLYVQNNPLTNIDVLTTIGPALSVLSLSLKNFQTWPTQFQNLTHIVHLTLDEIPFKNLSSDALKNVDSLTSLTISNSELEHVPEAICVLKDMQLFYFIKNKKLNQDRKPLVPCPGYVLNYVSFVDMSENELSAFPNVFDTFPSVKRLQLIGNKIHYIEADVIPHHPMVERLYLDGNRMKRIPGKLTQFSALKQLFLSNNDISTVEDCDLAGLRQLDQLYLNNNPVEYVSKTALVDAHLLQRLELGNTNLRKIPEALSPLTKLSYLNLTGSPIECDCSMKFLRSALPLDVQGTCTSSSQTINEYIASSAGSCP